MPDLDTSPLARALGRIPSGLYIVTTTAAGRTSGFVGSFVMQMGFEPPTVCVAVGKTRPHLAEMRSSGRFALSIVDQQSRGLMTGFFKKLPEGQTPFDKLRLAQTQAGSTVLADALAWLDCRITGEFATGDHIVVFGEVTEGALLREGDPSTHLRKSGLGY